MPNTLHSVCVPLRQYLVMSVLYGDSHQLPATLFDADLVGKVVMGVTGELPEKVLHSNGNDILLVLAKELISIGLRFSWSAKSTGWANLSI